MTKKTRQDIQTFINKQKDFYYSSFNQNLGKDTKNLLANQQVEQIYGAVYFLRLTGQIDSEELDELTNECMRIRAKWFAEIYGEENENDC